MSLTEYLLRPLLRTSSARPLITHYDDALGSRIELSVATTTNWAAKTANWLVEECDVQPGDEVVVDLPAHWQTIGILLGTWWCGAHVVRERTEAIVAFVGPEADIGAEQNTAIVSLDPMGHGLTTTPPDNAFDYLSEARSSGDDFDPLFPIPDDTPALLGKTIDQLRAQAQQRAGDLGISGQERVLSTRSWTQPDGLLDAVLAPLSVGAHLVQITGGTPETVAKYRETERTTVDLLD